MILLLDTHVLLWWLDDPAQLSTAARELIAEPANEVLVSAVSAWEIAIKRGLGKLTTPHDLESAIEACAFQGLSVTLAHALETERLPWHHRDPFDRMLLAQARLEEATLVSRDPMMSLYGVPLINA